MVLFDFAISLSQLVSMRGVHGMVISNDRDGDKENAHQMEIKGINVGP